LSASERAQETAVERALGNDDADVVVPFVRGKPGVESSPEIKERARILWCTQASGDAAATARLLAKELEGSDEPTPARQTIARWARDEQWAAQADAAWADMATRDRTMFELQRLVVNNMVLGEVRKRDVLTGAYDHDTEVGTMMLKASDLAGRTVERVIAALRMPEPPAPQVDDLDALERGEREARALGEMATRKRQPRRGSS